eukprot:IDg6298t1
MRLGADAIGKPRERIHQRPQASFIDRFPTGIDYGTATYKSLPRSAEVPRNQKKLRPVQESGKSQVLPKGRRPLQYPTCVRPSAPGLPWSRYYLSVMFIFSSGKAA